MITLLGSLLGFSTSIIPEILGFFKQGQANKQELAMLEAKAQYAQALSSMQLEELDAKAEIVETEKLYEHDMVYSLMTTQVADWVTALQAAWSENSQALFSAILSFWFGGRAMSKARAVIAKR